MDEPPDRHDVLAAVAPRELFGDAVDDPRELRRVYASLLKAFHAEDDPEAHAHVRALYEQARESHESAPGDAEPAPSAASALVATFEQDTGRLLQALATHWEELLREHPDLLGHAVHRAIAQGGPALDPAALDLLDAIVSDPRWTIDPRGLDRLDQGIDTLRQLREAAADERIPEPLRELIRRAWGLADDEIAELYLDVAERLGEVDLPAALAHLERARPRALGHLVGLRRRIVQRVLNHAPAEIPEPRRKKLRQTYPPSSLFQDEWDDRLGGLVEMLPVRIAVTVLLAVAFMAYMPHWMALIAAYLVRVGLLALVALAITSVQGGRPMARAHDGNIEPLLELCRELTLFPEEPARLIYTEPVAYDDEKYGFADGHPILELERDDTALFRVISNGHVQRVRAAMEASSG